MAMTNLDRTGTHAPHNGPLLVLTTWPEANGARELARELLRRRLAACINVLPPMTSFYVWDDQMESGEEHQLLIKTTTARFQAVRDAITQAHPYALAELIAIPIVQGLPDYLQWIEDSTS